MLIFKSQVSSSYTNPHVGKKGKEQNHTLAAFRKEKKAFLKPAAGAVSHLISRLGWSCYSFSITESVWPFSGDFNKLIDCQNDDISIHPLCY